MSKTSKPEIIAAARDLMREKGYAAASMKDVAAKVGLLKGSLYSHFSSKEDLVPEVLDLTYAETFGAMETTGDWLTDYRNALERLVDVLICNGRCIGMHLAYGMDDSAPALKQAVGTFFLDIRECLMELLRPGLDEDLAATLALDTILHLEGATLWLALFGNAQPMKAAEAALLARARAHAQERPSDDICTLLDDMTGDWRLASLAERRLAARTCAAEAEAMQLRAALAGQIEAESCFR